ncbi:MAG: hypothetical protein KatS3mg024_1116 [Armatimonadota bacterium]|nr:MAG: hypothetical protein KatS3mg024_1116 [Armatimonadota bacterium]
MRPGPTVVWGGLFAAFLLQAQVSGRIAGAENRPEFLLAFLLVLSVFSTGSPPVAAAFAVGLLEGVLCGLYTGAFIVSRIVAAVAASHVADRFNLSLPVVLLVSLIACATAHLTFLLVSSTADLGWWLRVTGRQILLTTLLAGVLYPFIARTARPSGPSLGRP